MKNTLKAWLVQNGFSNDPHDYIALVESAGSMGFDDIIEAMIAEGVENKRETLVDIIRRFQRISTHMVYNGYSVNTGQLYMRPVISGTFQDDKWDKTQHSVYIAMSQGADMRKKGEETPVEILGRKNDLMTIYRITNLVNGLTDGHLTKGRNVQIEGHYLKIAGNDPAVGIYFINTTTKTETRLEAGNILINHPTKLVIYLPEDLQAGNYRLRIVSQYTDGRLRKNIRENTFEQELVIS